MQPKAIGMGPVSRFFANCQLPAKAKAKARACVMLLFHPWVSILRLLDVSQGRYHCTTAPANVSRLYHLIPHINFNFVEQKLL